MKYEVDFWRCNFTKLIRIGKRDKYGVLRPVKHVAIVGETYSDAEAQLAHDLCAELNGSAPSQRDSESVIEGEIPSAASKVAA